MPDCDKALALPFRNPVLGLTDLYTPDIGPMPDCDPFRAKLVQDAESGLVKPVICRTEFSDTGALYRSADGMARFFVASPPFVGACCLPGGGCVQTTPHGCVEMGGTFVGERNCNDIDCSCDCVWYNERWPQKLRLDVSQIEFNLPWYNYCDVGAYSCPGCPGEEPAEQVLYRNYRGGFSAELFRCDLPVPPYLPGRCPQCLGACYAGGVDVVLPLSEIYHRDAVYRCRPFDVCPLACCRENIQEIATRYDFLFPIWITPFTGVGLQRFVHLSNPLQGGHEWCCGCLGDIHPGGAFMDQWSTEFHDGFVIDSPAVPPFCRAIDYEVPRIPTLVGPPIGLFEPGYGVTDSVVASFVDNGNCLDWINGFNNPLEGGYFSCGELLSSDYGGIHIACRLSLSVA